MSGSFKWPRERVLQLIYETKKHPIVWKNSKVSRSIKLTAWRDIGKKIGCPAAVARQKLTGLLAFYRKEKKTSERTNRPSTWYGYEYIANLLYQQNLNKVQKDSSDVIELSDCEVEMEEEFIDVNVMNNLRQRQPVEDDSFADQEQFQKSSISSSARCNLRRRSTTQSMFSSSEISEPEMSTSNLKMDFDDSEDKRNRQSEQDFEDEPRELYKKNYIKSDNSDIVAAYIASKLRRYNPRTRCIVEKEINDIFYRVDMENFDLEANSNSNNVTSSKPINMPLNYEYAENY